MPKVLNKDDTIVEVWPSLMHQREYVGGVRSRMLACVREHGNAYVRIGITGTGQKPYFRVTYRPPNTSHDDAIFGSYYDNREPLEEGHAIIYNWSTRAMSFDEVDAFLRVKTGWK